MIPMHNFSIKRVIVHEVVIIEKLGFVAELFKDHRVGSV